MQLTLRLVFLLVSIILFVIAAVGIPTSRFSVQSAGLAFLAAAFLVS
jgi:hypothetical protein